MQTSLGDIEVEFQDAGWLDGWKDGLIIRLRFEKEYTVQREGEFFNKKWQHEQKPRSNKGHRS